MIRLAIASLLAVVLLGGFAHADLVVKRDLTILEGPAQASGDGKSLTIGGKKLPMDQVLLWEDADGILKHRADVSAQFKALRAIARRLELNRGLEELPKAVEAGNGQAAQKLLERAERAGMEARVAEEWEKRVEGLGDAEGKGYTLPKSEAYPDVLVDRARAALENDEDDRNGLRMLRAALTVSPKYERATDLLDEFAPERFRIGDPKNDDIPNLWLGWMVEVLTEPRVRWLKRGHPDMARARGDGRAGAAAWKPYGIHGIETPEIVFITEMKDAPVVAICMKYARLTCRALETMFQTDDPQRLAEDDLPLVIYFYESRESYMQYATRGPPNPMLQFSAGFYIPTENVSRFFWPTKQASPELSARGTFVHELTHHWTERRNPRWHARDLADRGERAQVPGFWIVEGLATFIEEGRYDIETGKWSHFNPQAKALDITAALAKDGNLVDWEKQLTLTQRDFQTQLEKEKPHAHFRTRWKVFETATTEMRLFYEQAAATCHFLYWGEGGKYREAFKDYITNYYTSKKDKTAIKAAFGLTEEELGAKVEDFVKKVVYEGWRPDGA